VAAIANGGDEMTQEYVGPEKAFTLRYPDDWSCVRQALRDNELDRMLLYRTHGAIGAVRVTAWRLRDEADVRRFVVRTQELYAEPVEGEIEIMDLIRGNIGGKDGFIRISLGAEDRVPTFTQMFVIGAKSTVVMATYVVPLHSTKTHPQKAESQTVLHIVTDASLT